MFELDHLPGRKVKIESTEWLYCSGTAYLGIPKQAAFKQLLLEGIERYGTNFGGSRRSNMRLSIFKIAEQYLADWIGTESALTISSGSLAGQLLIKYLSKDHHLFIAPTAHPALWSGQSIPANLSFEEWIKRIPQKISNKAKNPAIFLSSIDPLLAKAFRWDWLEALPSDKRIKIIIDDSHGLGILGKGGAGILSLISKLPKLDYIIVSSLGKALGIPGGVIAGSKALIDGLWASPFFGGASPIIPAYLHAFVGAKEIYAKALLKLLHLIELFQSAPVVNQLFDYIPAYPVHYSACEELSDYLNKHKIFLSAFRYPTDNSPIVTRLIINALHEEEDIHLLLHHLNSFHKAL